MKFVSVFVMLFAMLAFAAAKPKTNKPHKEAKKVKGKGKH